MRKPTAGRPHRHGRAFSAFSAFPVAFLAACLATAAFPHPSRAQGAGSATAELLRMDAGARAAALGGAFTAVPGDVDGIFVNPAAMSGLTRAVGFGYQAYVEDVTLGSASGALRVGPVVLGAGLLFLDAGSIDEVVPDPLYGGERGQATGNTVGASEVVARVGAALPLLQGRATAGAAIGVYSSDLAGARRRAPFLDLGGQYRAGAVTIGAALRNLGPSASSADLGDAPLPLEARLGSSVRYTADSGLGAIASGDVVLGIEDRTTAVDVGTELGLLPRGDGAGAVLRLGYVLGEADAHLGRLRFGAGVELFGLALDYAVQSLDYLGTIHRIGIRWSR